MLHLSSIQARFTSTRHSHRVLAINPDVSMSQDGKSPSNSILRTQTPLIALLDSNPYLTDGSKMVLKTGVDLAASPNVQLLILTATTEANAAQRRSSIEHYLREANIANYKLIEHSSVGAAKADAILGEAADEFNSDLLIMSSESIHARQVDGNLLAEFVSCPILMLP